MDVACYSRRIGDSFVAGRACWFGSRDARRLITRDLTYSDTDYFGTPTSFQGLAEDSYSI